MSVRPGVTLGPYEIVAPIGAGGMGEVFEAYDVRLERRVALKVLRAEVAGDPDRLARFTREAKAVAALNHPNILTVHDVGVEDGSPYVVTELLEGENLREALGRRSPSHFQVLGWAVQITQGLAAAHQKGIVHRDIKPENLFLTTDGRIKILDFGLAKQTTPEGFNTSAATATNQRTASGVVLGTVAYLSPEQAQGHFVDTRSDIFSFGVVLYEMLARRHPFWHESGGAMMAAILRDTPVPLSNVDPSIPRALDGIVARCLSKEREERFQGAHDLRLALEAVLATPADSSSLLEVEERSPYPGIASFTEKDAAVFFGREDEVKALWERVRARPILAVIGPSGAGKTSFLRAGVIPARTSGWAVAYAKPGSNPALGLARGLTPELSGDSAAVSDLLGGVAELTGSGDPQAMVGVARRWRSRHAGALLVLDQFEELFTLNSPDVQARFAVLVARVMDEAGVRVVLSLRDDFLMRLSEHKPLAPVFDAIVPLGPIATEGLERALAEPARRSGYRFEDEELVGAMVKAVEGERGALPLLAFAVSRLWEKRDRERKLLTRSAYEEIGGVAGALAQHAEATMSRIGADKQDLVRDVFRNLVTAQGTRAVMDSGELLSAFADRSAAEAVMRQLVDAHLVTSYVVEGGPAPRRAVEVVHESLLSAWPRLVRWQAQDQEGSVLRDQLRQAARLWEEKKRAEDLLWTGTAFREFELWRERHQVKLTALEESFARAMEWNAARKKRRSRAFATGAFIALAGIAVAIGASRQQAVVAARRAEAAKLLAVAQNRLGEDTTEALALTTASLEIDDTWDARVFALRTLWEAPPALELRETDRGTAYYIRFSPDGRQLADGGYFKDAACVLPDDGGRRREAQGVTGQPHWVGGRLVVHDEARVTSLTLPDLKVERTVDLGGASSVAPIGSRLFIRTSIGEKTLRPDALDLRSWVPGEERLTELGRLPEGGGRGFSPDGAHWVSRRGSALVSRALPLEPGDAGTVLGEHPPEIARMRPSRWGNEVVTVNPAGESKLWTFEEGRVARIEDFPTPAGEAPVSLFGRWLVKGSDRALELWPRGSWSAARPLRLRRNAPWWGTQFDVEPGGDWIAASTQVHDGPRITFWPLARPYPLVVPDWRSMEKHLVFSPDSRWLASTWGLDVRLWPIGGTTARPLSIPFLGGEVQRIVFDPKGRWVFCVGYRALVIVPLDGSPVRRLEGFHKVPYMTAAAVSPSGRFVATARWTDAGDHALVVWDLEKDTSRSYPLPLGPDGKVPEEGVASAVFADDATLYTTGPKNVQRWDLATGRVETVLDEGGPGTLVRPDKGFALAVPEGRFLVRDLARKATRELTAFGKENRVFSLDRSGTVLAAGSRDGIRIGRLSGGEPQLLVGHEKDLEALAISPDLKWIASGGGDGTLRLWPMPDLDKPPLHTLPRAELVAKLKSLTNLRAVRDPRASAGWKIETGPFPGWRTAPKW